MEPKQIGVFTRNHHKYLHEATALSSADPALLITFRSSVAWSRAAAALENHSTIPVYFAVIGHGPEVRYTADLVLIGLNPRQTDLDTERLLHRALPSTKGERLWEDQASRVRTLYVIKRCRRTAHSFPMTQLVKVSDGAPISSKYGYSYSVVYRPGSEPDVSASFPDEVLDPQRFWEGATQERSVTSYERSQAARRVCIQHHGYDCAACGFNFEVAYGELGREFIHTHHLKALSEIDSSYEIDPVSDLIPLCPNCHAMIHRKQPMLSVEELRNLLRI